MAARRVSLSATDPRGQARMDIHRKLIEALNEDITPGELDGLKNVSMGRVRRGSVSQTRSVRELLQLLETKGVIAVGAYGELRTMIEQIEAPLLATSIDEAEQKLDDLDHENGRLMMKRSILQK